MDDKHVDNIGGLWSTLISHCLSSYRLLSFIPNCLSSAFSIVRYSPFLSSTIVHSYRPSSSIPIVRYRPPKSCPLGFARTMDDRTIGRFSTPWVGGGGAIFSHGKMRNFVFPPKISLCWHYFFDFDPNWWICHISTTLTGPGSGDKCDSIVFPGI